MTFFWPGPPAAQPVGVGDLRVVAQSALFVAVNGFISPSYFSHCPCDDGQCFQDGVEQRYFHLASFVTAMLGLVLVLGEMTFPEAVFRSQASITVAQWLVSLAKVATVGTFQHWANVFYLCLKIVYIRSYISYLSVHNSVVLM